MKETSTTSVAVVGAGPYGLSIAAHLRSAGVDLRIFGRPMHRWRQQMPKGMFLKSEGFASNLSDPDGRHTLAAYCAQRGIPYGDTATPVPLDVFTEYGLAFQKDLVPNVEEVMVREIERAGACFVLQLATGETLSARTVVVATGLENSAHVPPELATLPPDLVSHTSAHHDLGGFAGTDVTVIGGGQSALETAALLGEQGAAVRLLVRAPAVRWNAFPKEGRRSLSERLRNPSSPLGAGLPLWAYCAAPRLFRHLPLAVRRDRFTNVLGPAGGWWLKERVVGRLPLFTRTVVVNAEARPGRAILHVRQGDGQVFPLDTEHVIAATGYRVSLDGLPFLGTGLRAMVRTVGEAPVLSAGFESSVPGLYFTGIASGISFGPVMRFLAGADFTARRICHHLAVRQRERASLKGIGRLPAATAAR